MNPSEFITRWKQGIKDSSPRQQLEAKLIGLKGSIVGIIIGFTILSFKGAWYFSIMGFFMIWLQGVEIVGTNQQLENIKKIEENYGEMNK